MRSVLRRLRKRRKIRAARKRSRAVRRDVGIRTQPHFGKTAARAERLCADAVRTVRQGKRRKRGIVERILPDSRKRALGKGDICKRRAAVEHIGRDFVCLIFKGSERRAAAEHCLGNVGKRARRHVFQRGAALEQRIARNAHTADIDRFERRTARKRPIERRRDAKRIENGFKRRAPFKRTPAHR